MINMWTIFAKLVTASFALLFLLGARCRMEFATRSVVSTPCFVRSTGVCASYEVYVLRTVLRTKHGCMCFVRSTHSSHVSTLQTPAENPTPFCEALCVPFLSIMPAAAITGRPQGYIRQFGLCRVKFREMALDGKIPGITKASW